MKLSRALFTDSATSIYQVLFDEDWDNSAFEDWNLESIDAPILAADYVRDRLLDGEFIVKAGLVTGPGQCEPCYLEITMPEGIVNYTYVFDLGSVRIIQKTGRRKAAISLVAIEEFVDYDIFYSKNDPEVGLRVLRQALTVAKTRWPIAHSLSCILRDEGRYHEAVDAVTVVIDEGPSNLKYSNYQERARLLDQSGDVEGAHRDRHQAELILKARGK